MWRVVVGLMLLTAPAGIAAGAGEPGVPDGPRIVAIYPNPVAHDDAGEFVIVAFPEDTSLAGWALTDGEATVPLPNRTVGGRVVLSDRPELVRGLTDDRVLGLSAGLRLANDGETVRLLHDGTVIDAVRYRDAPEGDLGRRTGTGLVWEALGATDFPVVRTADVGTRVFVLPDADRVPVETLRTADRRILLAGYTLTSRKIATTLAAARREGVRVRVLVDAEPVGGMTRRQAAVLDALVDAGVSVEVVGGDRARYAIHHAKYAVVDDRAIVLTENWKPAGTGGNSSRGWGVVLDDPAIADALADVFRADAGWRDTTGWRAFRRGRSFEPAEVADGSYRRRFAPADVRVDDVRVLVAPDNAEGELVRFVDGADESVRVVQASIGGRKHPLLRAAVRAAGRGVQVRILLSRAWYVREENRALVESLNDAATADGLPLEARLARPRGRYGKVHAKGVIVDGDRVALGSLNWNNHSVRSNREVVVVLEGERAGAYFGRVFRADWRGGVWRLAVGLLVALVAVWALAATLGRRIRFRPE